MSKSNLCETATLKLILQNIAFANVGDTGGLLPSAAPGNLYLALYTSDPTDADTGSEATFGAYARQAIVRSASGFTVTGDVGSNAALIAFAEATSGSDNITFIAIHTAVTGGDMLFHGAMGTARLVDTGTTLEFAIDAITITED